MTRFAALGTAFAMSFAGSCGKTTCDTGSFLDTATGECVADCDNSIDDVYPAADSTDAYYRTTIEIEFDDREDAATLTVASADGAVTGTTTWSGDTLIFTPDSALSPSTAYTNTITYSCGEVTTTFTTSAVGATTNEAALVGKTYSLDLASGRFVQPEGIGSILGEFITQEVLIGVKAANSTEIEMVGAIATEDSNPPAQDVCDPTIPFPTADFTENPFFQIGPEDTTLSVAGVTVTIGDLVINGAFAPDGSYVDGAVLGGTIDTRPLVPEIDQNSDCSAESPRCCDTDVDPDCNPADDTATCCDEDQICELAFQIGVSCITCPADNEDFCLTLLVDSMQAVEVSGLTLGEFHLPQDEDTAAETSSNVCDNEACSGNSACTESR